MTKGDSEQQSKGDTIYKENTNPTRVFTKQQSKLCTCMYICVLYKLLPFSFHILKHTCTLHFKIHEIYEN